MKAYTDIEQSKKLAEIIPLESADMVLPFTRKENNEYVPAYAISRNYIEVHKKMSLLPAMDKSTLCKLIQPCWSLAALLNILPNYHITNNGITGVVVWSTDIYSKEHPNLIDACVEIILKLYEQKLL